MSRKSNSVRMAALGGLCRETKQESESLVRCPECESDGLLFFLATNELRDLTGCGQDRAIPVLLLFPVFVAQASGPASACPVGDLHWPPISWVNCAASGYP